MCLKVSFSKVIFRSLNLLPNAETSCVVVRRGPTADYEEDQKITCLQPVMGGVLCIFAPVDKNADIL